jgi:selenocysteine lyase/cysteine desulfurase
VTGFLDHAVDEGPFGLVPGEPRHLLELLASLAEIAGGGAVDLVDLDEVVWTDPPEREEAGSPNVLGAVALHAAVDEITRIGWDAVRAHDDAMAERLHAGLAKLEGVRVLGPAAQPGGLPVATFVVEGVPHALVAARLSAEHAIGVRHGCFCAHPYLLRLLDLSPAEVADYQAAVRRGDRRRIPGAVRASAGLSATGDDVDRFLDAVGRIAGGEPAPVPYDQDPHTGDFWPHTDDLAWSTASRRLGASCARG